MATWPSCWCLFALLFGASVASAPPAPSPTVRLAHGVFVAALDVPEDVLPQAALDAYMQAVGRRVSFVYLSNNWFFSRAFPLEPVRRVQAAGAVPVVRLLLRSSDEEASGPDPRYGLARLAAGQLDRELQMWARQAATVPGPVYVEYGTEVNGHWFSWNAAHNGRQAGAALFVRAYRHLAHVVRRAGAHNVRWVFHVDSRDDPDVDWNRLERYYPGGDVVSVLGVSAYGAQAPDDADVPSLRSQLDGVMPRLRALAPHKPVLLLEFGSASGASIPPEAWAQAALSDLTSGRWPALRGFAWWNSAWENGENPATTSELRVERLPALAAVFRRYLQSPAVQDGWPLR